MKKYKTFEEFQDAINLCNENIKNEFPYTEKTNHPILDGPLNPEKYFNSKIKIVWVLKEPVVLGGENENEPILYSKLIGDYWNYEKFLKGERTWYSIVYTSYGILNNFITLDNMPNIAEIEMGDCLHNIAIINISKYQAPYDRATYMNELSSTYNNTNKVWLKNQLELLEPQIVIFGFTFKVANLIEPKYKLITTKQQITEIYKFDDVLYFDSFHPSKPVNRATYCNDIILGTQEFLS